MLRISVCLVALSLALGSVHSVSAQTAAPAAAPAKPSKMKLTAEKLKDLKVRWSSNKGKLKECRKEGKSRGMAGEDRWLLM